MATTSPANSVGAGQPAPGGLPQGFEDLAPLAADWTADTTHARLRKRTATPLPELQAFYEALAPRMEAVMNHLAKLPPRPQEMPAQEQRLMLLAKMFMEVSLAVELFHAPDEPAVWNHEKMTLREFIPT